MPKGRSTGSAVDTAGTGRRWVKIRATVLPRDNHACQVGAVAELVAKGREPRHRADPKFPPASPVF